MDPLNTSNKLKGPPLNQQKMAQGPGPTIKKNKDKSSELVASKTSFYKKNKPTQCVEANLLASEILEMNNSNANLKRKPKKNLPEGLAIYKGVKEQILNNIRQDLEE
jgi:hypothetical protein